MLAAAIAGLGFVLARRHDGGAGAARGAYVCPMHPEVTSSRTGECPICGMALLKVGTFSREDATMPSMGAAAPAVGEDAIAAADLLSKAAGGIAPNLLGYYPSPVRKHMLRYEIYAPAWVEQPGVLAVLLYGDQLPTLEPGEHAVFSATADPHAELAVTLAPGAPERWDRSMSLVRFAPAPGAATPGPGTVGWVKFAARPRHLEIIPANAVLQSPDGPYVLVFTRERGTAAKRSIEVGRTFTGVSAVLSGLSLREQVVSVNAFFWDAERRLQLAQHTGRGGSP